MQVEVENTQCGVPKTDYSALMIQPKSPSSGTMQIDTVMIECKVEEQAGPPLLAQAFDAEVSRQLLQRTQELVPDAVSSATTPMNLGVDSPIPTETLYKVWVEAIVAAAKATLPKTVSSKMIARDVSNHTKSLFEKRSKMSRSKHTVTEFAAVQKEIAASALQDYSDWVERNV